MNYPPTDNFREISEKIEENIKRSEEDIIRDLFVPLRFPEVQQMVATLTDSQMYTAAQKLNPLFGINMKEVFNMIRTRFGSDDEELAPDSYLTARAKESIAILLVNAQVIPEVFFEWHCTIDSSISRNRRFPDWQRAILEKVYEEVKLPSQEKKKEVLKSLLLPRTDGELKRVNNWFADRRRKDRNEPKRAQTNPTSPLNSDISTDPSLPSFYDLLAGLLSVSVATDPPLLSSTTPLTTPTTSSNL